MALIEVSFGSFAPRVEDVFIDGFVHLGKGSSRPGVGSMKTHLKKREAIRFRFLDLEMLEPIAGLVYVLAEGL